MLMLLTPLKIERNTSLETEYSSLNQMKDCVRCQWTIKKRKSNDTSSVQLRAEGKLILKTIFSISSSQDTSNNNDRIVYMYEKSLFMQSEFY